jgi:hypothetical protein
VLGEMGWGEVWMSAYCQFLGFSKVRCSGLSKSKTQVFSW